ncbi:MAG: hypothetical protein ACJAQ8_002044, partial [Haliea salexigens]
MDIAYLVHGTTSGQVMPPAPQGGLALGRPPAPIVQQPADPQGGQKSCHHPGKYRNNT